MSVPKGMVASVLWSGVFGYLFLCAFVLMIPNMDEAAKQGWNVFFWGMGERVPEGIRTALYVLIFISQWLCGLATVTSVSRMLFAFSRDDGIPGISKVLAKVSPTYRVPANAIWAGSLLCVLFVWFTSAITIAGAPAYSIVVSCTVIFLFLSFAVPIALALFTYGTAKFPKPGPWDLGGASLQARLRAVVDLNGHYLLRGHSATERLGAADHGRVHRPVAGDLAAVREPPVQGAADRRRDCQAGSRDQGCGSGCRRRYPIA